MITEALVFLSLGVLSGPGCRGSLVTRSSIVTPH